VIIKGYVQGVGFRYWAYQRATYLGIKGYVKNRCDGSVEVLAAGEGENLEHFLQLLNKGPAGAQVDEVEIIEVSDSVLGEDFHIKYD